MRSTNTSQIFTKFELLANNCSLKQVKRFLDLGIYSGHT